MSQWKNYKFLIIISDECLITHVHIDIALPHLTLSLKSEKQSRLYLEFNLSILLLITSLFVFGIYQVVYLR